ncbi:NAD(P)-dependent alcohol dehydrogenase [Saccharothrix sp. Mg75]|uniref:NAD(P)-dependent alcohol dehydrogenase n=1 Tax=Saccharothrix sp. Mg75 TaxID=3445357 RepID=UPI003EE89A7C
MGVEQNGGPAQPPPGARRMRAIVQDEYGEALDVLRSEEVDRPRIAAGEVLVRVRAAGVDRGAWHIMAGLPYPIRLFGYGFRRPRTRVRGREVAGLVEAVGADVTAVRPGQEVYGIGEGCFAEYAVARQDRIAPKPANLDFAQAAAAPISGLTALQGVRDAGRVRAGQDVLVIGASGGVGTFAVQIAKALGAHVTGVCGTAKTDLVRSLGADHVIDHTREDITAGGKRYDVVLDIGGHRSLTHLRRVLTPRGRLVIVGSETGGRWLGGFDRTLRAPVLSLFTGQTLRGLVNSENARDLLALTGLVESGAVTPAVDRTYPLSDTPAAVQHVVDGHSRGKTVVVV